MPRGCRLAPGRPRVPKRCGIRCLAPVPCSHPVTAAVPAPRLSCGSRGVPSHPAPPKPPGTEAVRVVPRQLPADGSSAPSCPLISAYRKPLLPAPTLSWKVKRWEGPKLRTGLQILTERPSSCSLLRVNGKEVCGRSVPACRGPGAVNPTAGLRAELPKEGRCLPQPGRRPPLLRAKQKAQPKGWEAGCPWHPHGDGVW